MSFVEMIFESGGTTQYYLPRPQVPLLKADSGSVIASGSYNDTYAKWAVFDGRRTNGLYRWASSANTVNGAYVGYVFATPINIRLVYLETATNDSISMQWQIKTFKIQGSANGSSDWTDIKGKDGNTVFSVSESDYRNWYLLDNDVSYKAYRIYALTNHGGTDVSVGRLQFYTCDFE